MSAPGVRFLKADLAYGCHVERFDLSAVDGPFVILGPNGAGKTTIVEAVLRTLYGFRRGRKDERRTFEQRRPWFSGEYRGSVELEGPEGRFVVVRDFETDVVTVHRADEPRPIFAGEANPAASNERAREYRRLLAGAVGLADLDAYERTASVVQGQLIRTSLSEEILQIAAGGHADLDTAREGIKSEYHQLTTAAISADSGRRRKPGEVDRLEERITELERKLDEARGAEERRAPLAADRDRFRADMNGERGEIEQLEAALDGLSELEAARAAHEAALERLTRLEEIQRELDESLARLELMEVRSEGPGAVTYPDDYLERLSTLRDGCWPQEDEILEQMESEAARELAALPKLLSTVGAIAAGSVMLLGLGLALATTGRGGLVLGVAGGGLAVIAALLRWRVRWAEARRADRLRELNGTLNSLHRRIAALLEGIQDADTLTRATLPDRRRACEREMGELRLLADTRSELRAAMDRAGGALRAIENGAPEGAEETRAATPNERLAQRAKLLLSSLHDAVRDERDERLAPLKLQLRNASKSQLALPEGVPAESAVVRDELQRRRQTLRRRAEELADAERRLAYEGRPDESSVAIGERGSRLDAALSEARTKAAAYRHAYALVTDAYEEFRLTDQERLLDGVSDHLRRATSGDLGPIATAGGLDTARVLVGGRTLPLHAPPLSYGQLHSSLFAVRLGAADFLAELGVRVPLIVDDPFVHLDEDRAEELWRVLGRIARDRQVILATQDRLLLEHLGIEPDLDLGRRAVGEAPAASAEGADPVIGDSIPLDLWSSQPDD